MDDHLRPSWTYLIPPWVQQTYRYCEALLQQEFQEQGFLLSWRTIDNKLETMIREWPINGEADINNLRMSRVKGMLGALQAEYYKVRPTFSYAGASQFISACIIKAMNWTGARPLLYDAGEMQNAHYSRELAAHFGTVMQFFVDRLFMPICTLLESRIGDLRFRAPMPNGAARIEVFLLVTFVGWLGNTWTYRLTPGVVQDMWNVPDTVLEEAVLQDGFLKGSDATTVLMSVRANCRQIYFRAVTRPVIPSQARVRMVGVFPLVHTLEKVDLRRYQIFAEGKVGTTPPVYFKHCLIWSLELSGVPEETVRSIAARIPGRAVTLSRLEQTFKDVRLAVEVMYAENSNWRNVKTMMLGAAPESAQLVRLGMVENHVFINELCSITKLYIQNALELPEHHRGYTNLAALDHGVPSRYYEEPRTSSFDVINLIYHTPGLLKQPSMYDVEIPFRRSLKADEFFQEGLSYDTRLSTRKIEATEKEKEAKPLWFADFETFATGEHETFLLCFAASQGPVRAVDCAQDQDGLQKAVMKLLDAVGEGIVYFHNLSYDGVFILQAVCPMESSIVEQGSSRLLSFKVRRKGKITEFRDSLALMPFPLRDFSKMLGVSIEKEVMPYRAYSRDVYHLLMGVDWVYSKDSTHSPDELRAAAIRADALADDDRIDLWTYAVYYCRRDVEVLREGFLRMDKMMFEATGQHLWTKLTAPSLAFHSLRRQGVFEGCYELSGVPANIIRRTVVGGRCMLARNQKQECSEPVSDFDAVSLYPSAMAQLYTLQGLPKILTVDDIANFGVRRLSWDAYFVEIQILEVRRHMDFPLISYKGNGNRSYNNRPGRIWVNDITLDDLCEFHLIKYEVIRGYYFNEGKNYKIQEVITQLFNLRLEAKRAKQPIEVIYKLLMNSCYGKTIMKPKLTQKNVIPKNQVAKEMQRAPMTILSFQELKNGNVLLRESVDVLENWSMPSLGSHILAMSKRIVTQVTSLCQDLGIKVLYTDTDSIHLPRDSVGYLAQCFREKYGRELIGKGLGQFHTDFPVTERGMMWSKRFVGVGKKSYIDVLTDGVEERYHIRMKGIPELSLLKVCERRGITPLELYERFLRDEEFEVSFDLADAKPCFDRKSDMSIQTLEHFYRALKFSTAADAF